VTTVLVVGATGATGRLLVRELLQREVDVRVIVRSLDRLPDDFRGHPKLTVTEASLLELSDADLAAHVDGCAAVSSCLGHTMTVRGVLGPPRRLVTDATRRLCEAVQSSAPARPVRFALMNTAGNHIPETDPPTSLAQRAVVALIRLLIPPHADNEQAAAYLRHEIGQDHPAVRWCIVRPDTLVNNDRVSPYEVHPVPTRSAIFNAGKTSRVNVAHFMASLITDNGIWEQWGGKAPAIYGRRHEDQS